MQGIKPETLTDEEFMKYAYLQGLGKLDERWVKELYDRLQRSIDEKDKAYDEGYADGAQ